MIWLQLWDTVRDKDEAAALSALSRFDHKKFSLDERWNLWPELAHLPKGACGAGRDCPRRPPLPASHGHAPRDSENVPEQGPEDTRLRAGTPGRRAQTVCRDSWRRCSAAPCGVRSSLRRW